MERESYPVLHSIHFSTECWLDPFGPPKDRPVGYQWTTNKFPKYLFSFEPDFPVEGRSLCDYLIAAPEADGLRAYVEYVTRERYSPFFAFWTYAQKAPLFKERTSTFCYDELTASNTFTVQNSMERMLDFLYNGTSHEEWELKDYMTNRHAHGTSQDHTVRDRLTQMVRKLDQDHYNGDLAWLSSILPCQSLT